AIRSDSLPRNQGAYMPVWALYTVTVLVWGVSWHAIHYQVGVVAPALSIAYRFLLAAAIMVVFCLATRRKLRCGGRDLALMTALGMSLFCVNYILFYYAALHLATGLLAVVFSLITVMNVSSAAVLLGQKIEPGGAVGALRGLGGMALTLWPDIAGQELIHEVGIGLVLSLLGTLSASLGNMAWV